MPFEDWMQTFIITADYNKVFYTACTDVFHIFISLNYIFKKLYVRTTQ